MAARSWPTTYGRSDKPKMPLQIKNFMQSYVARHVQDKMDPKTFMSGYVYIYIPHIYIVQIFIYSHLTSLSIQRHFTMATYKNTELGQVQQALSCAKQKCKRRKDKVLKLKKSIVQLKEKSVHEDLTAKEKALLVRQEFEHKHELADVAALQEEIKQLKTLQDDKRSKKKQQDQIFQEDREDEAEQAGDALLEDLYGIHKTAEIQKENVLEFKDM